MKRWLLLLLLCMGQLPAYADNCSGLSDCMNQPKVWALIIAAIAIGFLLAPLLAELGIASILRILGREALRRLITIGGRTLGRLSQRSRLGGPEAKSRVKFEQYKDDLIRQEQNYLSKPSTKDPALSKIRDRLFRGDAKVGNGGTADAVREELTTGVKVGGREHSQKAREEIENLTNWLRDNPNAHPNDRSTAEKLLSDLKDALNHVRTQR